MDLKTWRKETYRDVFRRTCKYVAERKAEDPNFSRKELEGMLTSAYFEQGNDWAGKGETHALTISATIAAYEKCLAEWDS